jgi:hypothetical protein
MVYFIIGHLSGPSVLFWFFCLFVFLCFHFSSFFGLFKRTLQFHFNASIGFLARTIGIIFLGSTLRIIVDFLSLSEN